jgi:hypothetical protein
MTALIVIIYSLVILGCLVFLLTFKLKNHTLLANAIWIVIFAQLITYGVQLYEVLKYSIVGCAYDAYIQTVLESFFYSKIPEIIGIGIFLSIYFTTYYRERD